MDTKIALDSNILTYLINSFCFTDHDDPANNKELAEHVATLRLYLYTGYTFFLPPTARSEYLSINDPKNLEAHLSTHQVLIDDILEWDIDYKDLDLLMSIHNKERDCKIYSEAASGKMDVLLTNDDNFESRLKTFSGLKILKPTELWRTLAIQKNAIPEFQPHESNPLAQQTFWLWDAK